MAKRTNARKVAPRKKAAAPRKKAAAKKRKGARPTLAVDNTGSESLAGIGHNSDEPAPDNQRKGMAIERLRGLVERIERLNEERAATSSDIRDLFTEAKSAGFDTKVLRKLIAIRKREPAEVEEEEILLETYRGALGMK